MRGLRVFINAGFVIGIVGIISWFAFRKGGDIVIRSTIPAIVERLHSVQKLETAQMDITKIIEGEKEVSDTIPGTDLDDKIAAFFFEDTIRMEVYGQVIAGFELNLIKSSDLSLGGDTLSILLPQPSILHTIVDDKTRVYDRERGLLTKGDPQLESAVREQARSIIREAALSGGILEKARDGAQEAFESLLGESVTIKITYE